MTTWKTAFICSNTNCLSSTQLDASVDFDIIQLRISSVVPFPVDNLSAVDPVELRNFVPLLTQYILGTSIFFRLLKVYCSENVQQALHFSLSVNVG